MRGEIVDAILQKIMRIGIVVSRAKSIHVKIPPPTFRARYPGTSASRETSRTLEKLSLPEASAGKGAFFIEGYWRNQFNSKSHIWHDWVSIGDTMT